MDGSRQQRFLIINLVLLAAFIFCLVLAIVVYRFVLAPKSVGSPTITSILKATNTATITPSPTPIPTSTRTLRPSLTPSITPTPTQTGTVTPTPTPTGPPTLTPAKPLVFSGAYDLVDWNSESADRLILLMDYYPNTLSAAGRGTNDISYYAAYSYAVTALREAIMRFPTASQAEQWRWMLAYNLARMGDSQAASNYADLIAGALNRGDTDLGYLYQWFHENEPRFDFLMVEISPPSSYSGSYLIELRGPGSAFIWLLETTSGFQAHALVSHFDFVNSPRSGWIVAELNGDAQDGDEVAIYFTKRSREYQSDPPLVFNFSQFPPRQLNFEPQRDIFNLGITYENYWSAVAIPDQSGHNNLRFQVEVFDTCPVTIRRDYQWSGENFEFVEESYSINPNPAGLNSCSIIIDHAAYTWGPAAAIAMMEPLLDEWPPERQVDGKPYPKDANDEWRYRLGIYYALIGKIDQSKKIMNEVVNSPSVATSRFITPAQTFLETYKKKEDVYRACVESNYCNPHQAIEFLIANLPSGEEPLSYLWDAGVSTHASGFFDFDGDKKTERWFSVRYRPLDKLEFWILAVYSGGYKPLHVAAIDTNVPNLEYIDQAFIDPASSYLHPAVFLDSAVAFSVRRLPGSREPYLVPVVLRAEYPNRFLDAFKNIQASFYAGESPLKVRSDLLNLAQYPGLLCKGTWSCDPYYYLLGLVNELAGDERGAVEAYHRLWSDYSKSPFTIMARLKLSGQAFLTATPTPSLTPSLTLSPTASMTSQPTVTGTPPTATPSPSMTSTMTPTQTLQPGVTPSPSMTPTPTPTVTNTNASPYP